MSPRESVAEILEGLYRCCKAAESHPAVSDALSTSCLLLASEVVEELESLGLPVPELGPSVRPVVRAVLHLNELTDEEFEELADRAFRDAEAMEQAERHFSGRA